MEKFLKNKKPVHDMSFIEILNELQRIGDGLKKVVGEGIETDYEDSEAVIEHMKELQTRGEILEWLGIMGGAKRKPEYKRKVTEKKDINPDWWGKKPVQFMSIFELEVEMAFLMKYYPADEKIIYPNAQKFLKRAAALSKQYQYMLEKLNKN